MNYWLFKCDPKRYRLSDRLSDQKPDISWLVTRYRNEIAVGDTVFLLETGKKRAIRAVMRVDQGPAEMAELESEQAYWVEGRDTATRCRVRGTITHRVELPVAELEAMAELRDSAVFRGQGTNFRVAEDQGQFLISLIDQVEC